MKSWIAFYGQDEKLTVLLDPLTAIPLSDSRSKFSSHLLRQLNGPDLSFDLFRWGIFNAMGNSHFSREALIGLVVFYLPYKIEIFKQQEHGDAQDFENNKNSDNN